MSGGLALGRPASADRAHCRTGMVQRPRDGGLADTGVPSVREASEWSGEGEGCTHLLCALFVRPITKRPF